MHKHIDHEWRYMLALLLLLTIGLPMFALGGSLVASSFGFETGGTAPLVRTVPDRCFSAKHWSPAPDGLRPCVTIARLYEDGSFKARVSDANGTVRYSLGVGVPNGYECRSGSAPAACR